jgi:hypothetical protein
MKFTGRVKNTLYNVEEVHDGHLVLSAIVGPNSVEVKFAVLKIEWEKDFDVVRQRLKDILTDSINHI